MIGSSADIARSSRTSVKPPSTSVAEPDVDDGEIRQPALEGRQRLRAVGVGRDLVTLAAERVGDVLADGGVVLDDGDAAAHAWAA